MPDAEPVTTASPLDALVARRHAIGSLIGNAREIAGRKPKEIADVAGISPSVLHSIESGEREASLPQIEAIAHFLRVPVHTLLGISAGERSETSVESYEEIIRLRGHIIGARLKQARMLRGETPAETATAIGSSAATIQAYEIAKKQPGITELEALMAHFGLGLNDMLDVGIGLLGEAQLLQQQHAQFEALPEDIRAFVCDTHARPQLALAMRLRGLTPKQLQSLADAFAVLARESEAGTGPDSGTVTS
jgi:transcriptional regulator with XRE-family HTH domain